MAYCRFCSYLILSVIILYSSGSTIKSVRARTSVEPIDIYYAGVSYLGNYSYIRQNYPVALELNTGTKDQPVGELDAALNALIAQTPPQFLTIKKDMANLKAGQSFTMVLAIDSEYVCHENIGGSIKMIAEISGQLLFFDFSKMTLFANYPIAVAKNHVIDTGADIKAESKKLLQELYLGSGDNPGFLRFAALKLAAVNVRETAGLRFQVANVDISNAVAGAMPETTTEQRFKQYLGQYLSARLALGYHIEVLPFVKGYAIGNRMAGRFSNGEVYNLTLPDPDYIFNISVTNLKQQPFNNGDLLFAAQMRFVFQEPRQGKNYINGLFHYAVPKLVAKNQSDIDAWAAYVDVMEVLLDELVDQLGHPDGKWLKTHGGNKESVRQFKKKKGLFNGK